VKYSAVQEHLNMPVHQRPSSARDVPVLVPDCLDLLVCHDDAVCLRVLLLGDGPLLPCPHLLDDLVGVEGVLELVHEACNGAGHAHGPVHLIFVLFLEEFDPRVALIYVEYRQKVRFVAWAWEREVAFRRERVVVQLPVSDLSIAN
jgi:hypothetical protein